MEIFASILQQQPEPVEAIRALSLGMVVMIIALYFLPTFLGWKKKNRGAIFAVNFFLGWTVIDWIVAFVWAVTYEAVPSQVIINQAPAPAMPTAAVLCSSCGKYSLAGSQFCPNCGASILTSGAAASSGPRPIAN